MARQRFIPENGIPQPPGGCEPPKKEWCQDTELKFKAQLTDQEKIEVLSKCCSAPGLICEPTAQDTKTININLYILNSALRSSFSHNPDDACKKAEHNPCGEDIKNTDWLVIDGAIDNEDENNLPKVGDKSIPKCKSKSEIPPINKSPGGDIPEKPKVVKQLQFPLKISLNSLSKHLAKTCAQGADPNGAIPILNLYLPTKKICTTQDMRTADEGFLASCGMPKQFFVDPSNTYGQLGNELLVLKQAMQNNPGYTIQQIMAANPNDFTDFQRAWVKLHPSESNFQFIQYCCDQSFRRKDVTDGLPLDPSELERVLGPHPIAKYCWERIDGKNTFDGTLSSKIGWECPDNINNNLVCGQLECLTKNGTTSTFPDGSNVNISNVSAYLEKNGMIATDCLKGEKVTVSSYTSGDTFYIDISIGSECDDPPNVEAVKTGAIICRRKLFYGDPPQTDGVPGDTIYACSDRVLSCYSEKWSGTETECQSSHEKVQSLYCDEATEKNIQEAIKTHCTSPSYDPFVYCCFGGSTTRKATFGTISRCCKDDGDILNMSKFEDAPFDFKIKLADQFCKSKLSIDSVACCTLPSTNEGLCIYTVPDQVIQKAKITYAYEVTLPQLIYDIIPNVSDNWDRLPVVWFPELISRRILSQNTLDNIARITTPQKLHTGETVILYKAPTKNSLSITYYENIYKYILDKYMDKFVSTKKVKFSIIKEIDIDGCPDTDDPSYNEIINTIISNNAPNITYADLANGDYLPNITAEDIDTKLRYDRLFKGNTQEIIQNHKNVNPNFKFDIQLPIDPAGIVGSKSQAIKILKCSASNWNYATARASTEFNCSQIAKKANGNGCCDTATNNSVFIPRVAKIPNQTYPVILVTTTEPDKLVLGDILVNPKTGEITVKNLPIDDQNKKCITTQNKVCYDELKGEVLLTELDLLQQKFDNDDYSLDYNLCNYVDCELSDPDPMPLPDTDIPLDPNDPNKFPDIPIETIPTKDKIVPNLPRKPQQNCEALVKEIEEILSRIENNKKARAFNIQKLLEAKQKFYDLSKEWSVSCIDYAEDLDQGQSLISCGKLAKNIIKYWNGTDPLPRNFPLIINGKPIAATDEITKLQPKINEIDEYIQRGINKVNSATIKFNENCKVLPDPTNCVNKRSQLANLKDELTKKQNLLASTQKVVDEGKKFFDACIDSWSNAISTVIETQGNSCKDVRISLASDRIDDACNKLAKKAIEAWDGAWPVPPVFSIVDYNDFILEERWKINQMAKLNRDKLNEITTQITNLNNTIAALEADIADNC